MREPKDELLALTNSQRQLNPGGVIEIQDIVYPCKSDDGSVTKDQPIYRWSKIVADGFASMGRPVDTALGYRSQLEEAGFTNIVCHTHKWPLNRWPKDEKYKEIGMFLPRTRARFFHLLIRPRNLDRLVDVRKHASGSSQPESCHLYQTQGRRRPRLDCTGAGIVAHRSQG